MHDPFIALFFWFAVACTIMFVLVSAFIIQTHSSVSNVRIYDRTKPGMRASRTSSRRRNRAEARRRKGLQLNRK